MLITKALVDRGADGRFIGFNFLVFSGFLGTILLIILTCLGSGLYAIELKGTLLIMLAGVTGVASIAMLQYAISIGVLGIVGAIFNTSNAWFTLLCYFFLNESLST